jgi:hypothetical protein
VIRQLSRSIQLSYLPLAAVLFAFGGLLTASASYEGDVLTCVTGVLAFLLGALTVVAARPRPRRSQAGADTAAVWDPTAAPLLGEMLVSRRLISKEVLASALEQKRFTTKRLGEVLLEMGAVTHAQLARTLEEQSARRGWQVTESPRA